jgi:hypothetical protein
VPPPRPARDEEPPVVVDPVRVPDPWRRPTAEAPGTLKLGWELSGAGAMFAFICWGIWAASSQGGLDGPLLAFAIVLVVAVGVFAVSRLVGRMVLVQRFGRTRRSARAAHAVTGLFLVVAGLAYLRQTPWVVEVWEWVVGLR